MVRVRMLTSIASADWSYAPKDEPELTEEIAKAWAEVGHCVILEAGEQNDKTDSAKASGGTGGRRGQRQRDQEASQD